MPQNPPLINLQVKVPHLREVVFGEQCTCGIVLRQTPLCKAIMHSCQDLEQGDLGENAEIERVCERVPQKELMLTNLNTFANHRRASIRNREMMVHHVAE
jgi:hypothetical protein